MTYGEKEVQICELNTRTEENRAEWRHHVRGTCHIRTEDDLQEDEPLNFETRKKDEF
jgi:hypothetical protein